MAEARSAEMIAAETLQNNYEHNDILNSGVHVEHTLNFSGECDPTRTPRRSFDATAGKQLSVFNRLRQRVLPRRLVSIQLFVVCMCVMASLSSALSTGYVNSVISTIEKRFEIGSFLAGTIAASYEFGCISLLLVTYYGGRRHIPYWIGTGAIIMACGAFLFTVPHLITDSYTLRFTMDTNRSVPNLCSARPSPQSSVSMRRDETSASAAQIEQSVDQQGTSAKRINMFVQNECDITETQSKNEARYVFVLIIAQMLIGWGGAPNLALGTAYIDAHCIENGSQSHRAPMYIAFIYAASSLGTVLGFAVGALMLRFRVDYHLPTDYAALNHESLGDASQSNEPRTNASADQEYSRSVSTLWATMQSTDPRWIGAWWAGFLLFGALLLLASGCFFLFPKRIDETEREKQQRKRKVVSIALETVDSRLDQLAGLNANTPELCGDSVPVERPASQQKLQSSHIEEAADSDSDADSETDADAEEEGATGGYATVNVTRCETPMSASVSASASSQSQSAVAVTARGFDSAQYGRDIRELPRAIMYLFRNSVFVVTALGICFIVSIVSGFVVFLPKHLEQQFSLTKSSANLLTGTIAVPGASLGILLGGLLVRRLQLAPVDAVKLSIALHFATLICYLLTFALGCNNIQLAGVTVHYDFTFDTHSSRFSADPGLASVNWSAYFNDSHHHRMSSRSHGRDVLKFGTQIRDDDYARVYTSYYEAPSFANLSAQCNSACRCASQRVDYVCVEELGVTFFSPCYAGCRTEQLVIDGRLAAQLSVDAATPQSIAHFERVLDSASQEGASVQRFYTDCDCLDEALRRSLNVSGNASAIPTNGRFPFTVTPGICDKKCRMLAPFLIVLFAMTVLVTSTQMPLLNVVLRSVAECERTFALGIMFIFVRLSAYLPSPIVFGSVIDTTCLLRRDELELPVSTCDSGGTVLNNKLNRYADKRSSCELYDVVKFRMRYTGLLTIYEFASLFCFIVVLLILQRRSVRTCAPQVDGALPKAKARRSRQHPVTRFFVETLRFRRRGRRHRNADTAELNVTDSSGHVMSSSSTSALGASSF